MPESHEHFIDEFIQNTLGFIFDDLPQDEKELNTATQDIKAAFENRLKPDHPFICFQNCLLDPTNNLFRIERVVPNLTLNDVQEGLYRFAEQVLKNAYTKANLPFEKANFDKSLLTPFLKNPKGNEPFHSGKSHAENKEEVSTLFDFNLIHNNDFKIVRLEITTQPPLAAETIVIEHFADIPEEFKDDQEQDAWLENLNTVAIETAEDRIAHLVVRKFTEAGLINREINLSPGTKRLITNIIYFNFISSGIVELEEIDGCSIEQANNLLLPEIISLYRKGILTLIAAADYTEDEVKVITHFYYHGLIAQQALIIEKDIQGITHDQSMVLVQPAITQLIRAGIITFDEAKAISKNGSELLKHEFYLAFFLKPENKKYLPLLEQITPVKRRVLHHPGVVSLLVNHVISLEQAFNISLRTTSLFVHKKTLSLVCDKIISIEELSNLSIYGSQNIESDPLIYLLVKAKILAARDTHKIITGLPFPPRINGKIEVTHPFLPHIVPVFLKYAEKGLLFLSDLYYIYNHIEYFQLGKQTADLRGVDFFENHELIKVFIIFNLTERLKSILVRKPFPLQENKEDSIDKIKRAATEAGISFDTICRNTLRTTADHVFDGPPLIIIRFLERANELGITPRIIWGVVFGQKLFNTLNNTSSTEKEFAALFEKLKQTAHNANIIERKLRGETIRFALIFLKEKILKEMNANNNYPKQLQKVCEIISLTEETTTRKDAVPVSFKWHLALKNISNALQEPSLPSNPNEEKSNHDLKIFRRPLVLADLKKNIKSLNDLLPIEHFNAEYTAPAAAAAAAPN